MKKRFTEKQIIGVAYFRNRPEEDMTKIIRMAGLIYANVEGSNDRCRTGEDLGASLS